MARVECGDPTSKAALGILPAVYEEGISKLPCNAPPPQGDFGAGKLGQGFGRILNSKHLIGLVNAIYKVRLSRNKRRLMPTLFRSQVWQILLLS